MRTNWTEKVEQYLREKRTVSGGAFNTPALWRLNKFYSIPYPITQVASVQGVKSVQVDLKKYISGDSDFLDRIFVRVFGNIVIAGAGAGVATGADNPTGLLVSANLSSAPTMSNCVPINNVSSRGLRYDDMLDAGWLDAYSAVADTAGTTAVDFYVPINLRRSDGVALEGIDWSLAAGKYNSLILTLLFGGRDQLFSGGVNTWDCSGLAVELYADIEMGINPQFIHAHEVFETNFPVPATTKDFQITTLSSGFIYTDLMFLTENAGALTEGILNNIAVFNGAQSWTNKGEGNAKAIRQLYLKRNNRTITADQETFTGIFPIPMRDGMFTRTFDARFSPLTVSLDVNNLSASTNIRLVGRRMVPGAVYTRPKNSK